MELIEREALVATLKRVKWLSDADGLAAVQLANTAPTIDPIRAAGGCWCGECKRYGPGPFGYGCHTIFDGKAEVIPHNPEHFCGDGEPREVQDDG